MRATGVMVFFLSKGYFASQNCLREIHASLNLEKPVVLVHEQQENKGGGPLELLKAECPEKIRGVPHRRTTYVPHDIAFSC